MTGGTLLEHVANNLLSDANPVILQVAITGLYVLLAVERLATSDAKSLRRDARAFRLCLSLSDTLLFVFLCSIADLESAHELSLSSVIKSILPLLDLNHCLQVLVLGDNAFLIGACVRTSHVRVNLDALRLHLAFHIFEAKNWLGLTPW